MNDKHSENVLIIEDDPAMLRGLKDNFEYDGYRVATATDGESGLHSALNDRPDLIVLDIMLPKINGYEVCRLIREAPGSTYTYFIILTAKDATDDVVAGLEAGADDYVVKPFIRAELKRRIGIGERILRLEQEILNLATTDALTGLLNRRAVMERIQVEISRARRSKITCSLIMLDIDHFKHVNDQHGHQVGDAVLADLGALLKQDIRPYDLVGRYGGEEFVGCLPRTGLSEASQVAERWRRAISELRVTAQPETDAVQFTASFGVACLEPDTEEGLEDLLSRADKALYQAKAGGRNRVCT